MEMSGEVIDVLSFAGNALEDSENHFHSLLDGISRSDHEKKSFVSSGQPLVLFYLDFHLHFSIPSLSVVEQCEGEEKKFLRLALENHLEVPVIQLFGSTLDGTSVSTHLWGYFGYMYIRLPIELSRVLDLVQSTLENELKTSVVGRHYPQKVLSVEPVYSKNLLHYSGDKESLFCRIVLILPQLVSTLRTAIERGVRVNQGPYNVLLPTTAFDANIPHELKFMADTHISGGSWIEIASSQVGLRSENNQISCCQIEADVFYKHIKVLELKDQWRSIPPLRLLSFDIECVTNTGVGFPVPEHDKVIQIATAMCLYGGDPYFKTVFTLGSCSKIPGTVVCWFDSEEKMLNQWRKMVVRLDPDIITGYNCINFDLNYLLIRAQKLRIPRFAFLSRLVNTESCIKDVMNVSRQTGTFENKLINTEGRLQMDMLHIIRRDHKLKSYTLNAVSAHFIKQQKEDVHYSIIGQLFHGTSETRKRLATYCLKDALLPLQLMEKLCVLVNYVEMARVTGVPISFLLTRGQQIKVTSQILRKCRELNYVFPSLRLQKSVDDKYEGATVLDPLKGLYKLPIATLDFASLYPSVIMAHNLCYSSLCVEPIEKLGLGPDDVIRTPNHCVFVKPHKCTGVLPMIVHDLVEERKRTKEAMEKETNPEMKAVLNGRQLALKISANSVYGYTGATAGGQLPCLEVSTSITAYGRDMILKTKQIVEEVYRVENGYPFNAVVIYGDTDSVMVLFGVSSIAEAMKLGQEAAQRVTKEFQKPIRLEFEKVFCPFLLMNKKRYAGVLYTSPEAYSRLDFKGIETVRRDFCLLVQELVDTVLKKLLLEQDEQGAKDYVRYIVSELLQNNIDLSLLVMSKSLGKEEYTSKLAHVELAKKLRQRDPGKSPQIGDRIHFVIVPGVKGQPQYDRAEDPLYVLEHNMTIDTNYYLDHIKNPLIRIFEAIMDHPESLFSGAHTQKRKMLTSSASALSKFVKASLRCLGCRSVIKEGALCDFCRSSKSSQLILQKLNELRHREMEFSTFWTQCQRCQGSLTHEVICTSRDCPIFYRRMKAKKDLEELEQTMASGDLFTRFVEPGRLCSVEYGPDATKICAIVDIIDQNRVLVDGPSSGVARQSIPLHWLKLTDIVVKHVRRGCRTSSLKKLLENQRALEAYHESKEGKKRAALQFRAQMTDFERFKLMVAHKRRRALLASA